MSARLAIALILLPAAARAHGIGEARGAAWWEPVLLALAMAALWLYLRGLTRLWRSAGQGRGVPRRLLAAFLAGWTALVVAVLPPVLRLVEGSFSAHMVEHEAMMLVAAPLLVTARPLVAWLWAFDPATRRRLAHAGTAPLVAAAWRFATHPLAAWLLHAAALWGWHMPGAFAAALANPALHFLQHLSFLVTALFFWWSLFNGAGPMRHGAALASLFTTVLHTSVLGALIAVAPLPWYANVALADQQLAGVLMWVPGGLVYVGVALWLVVDWMRTAEARTRAWERKVGAAHVG